MDDLIDMMVKDASASAISDKIKDILMQKSAANIDAVRPQVAAQCLVQLVQKLKQMLQKRKSKQKLKLNHLQN